MGLFVQARNLALNLYRESGWTNMAQANRRCPQSLESAHGGIANEIAPGLIARFQN